MPAAPTPRPSVLLLDRAGVEPGPRPIASPEAAPAGPGRPTPPDSLFRAPGLAVLAAWSVLEGYRWFGVIAEGGSRPWAVVFAVAAAGCALTLTRADRWRRHAGVQRLVVIAATAVVLATAAVLWNHRGWSTEVLGIADLALATAALAALVAGERSRRRGDVAA